MAVGKRKRQAQQASMWVATADLPRSAAHPFYMRLNQILDQHDFDRFVEYLCQRFYADDARDAPLALLPTLFNVRACRTRATRSHSNRREQDSVHHGLLLAVAQHNWSGVLTQIAPAE